MTSQALIFYSLGLVVLFKANAEQGLLFLSGYENPMVNGMIAVVVN